MIVSQIGFVIESLLAYNECINPTTNQISDTHGVNSARRSQIYWNLPAYVDITLCR